MKRIIFLLTIVIAFTECDNFHNGNVIVDFQDTAAVSLDTIVPADSLDRTSIQENYCYEIQSFNELGQLVDGLYECMLYDSTYGYDFRSAYEKIEPQIYTWSERLCNDYKHSDMWDANRLEVRQLKCPVRNAPNNKMEFTSIDFYMYNKTYQDYVIIMLYCVIDSEGNLYHIHSGDD